MTREEAIKVLGAELKERSDGYYSYLAHYGKQDKAEEEFLDSLDMAIAALRYDGPKYVLLSQPPEDAQYIDTGVFVQPRWISVEEFMPDDWVSVLGHMTDAGEFPSVRECYAVNGNFWFPALHEFHPVSHWAPMPTKE